MHQQDLIALNAQALIEIRVLTVSQLKKLISIKLTFQEDTDIYTVFRFNF